MRKILLSAAITLTALSALADFNGDGYYRVQNAMTKRYAYLLDDKGSIDYKTGSADVKAIKLFMDVEKMKSDPATIFYIDCVDGEGETIMTCNIAAQGTSLYSFFSSYMKVMGQKEIDGKKTYLAYASKSGMTKYLGDRRKSLDEDEGIPDVEAAGDYRKWYIDAVDPATEDSYFGISPTLTSKGKYYHPFFADFPFECSSPGMKVYAVTKIDATNGVAIIKEVEGTVAASTPVLIECSSPLVSGNRLNIGGNGASVADNKLKGVYFNNETPFAHRNLTPYNKRSMRILTEKDGILSFEVAEIENLPRNQAYLQLSDEKEYAQPSYKVMLEADYEDQYGAVATIGVDAVVDVYSLDGNLIKSGISRGEVYTLGKGLYILRSGAEMEKLIVP